MRTVSQEGGPAGYADLAVALDFSRAMFDSVSCVRYQDSVMCQSE